MTTPELTVEQAIKDLRQMLPHAWMFVADRVTWPQGSQMPTRSVVIEVERHDNAFFDSTLERCMAQVRAWHKAQEFNTTLAQRTKEQQK